MNILSSTIIILLTFMLYITTQSPGLIHSLCIRNYFCCIFFYSDDFHKDTLSLNSYYNNDFLICKLIYGL